MVRISDVRKGEIHGPSLLYSIAIALIILAAVVIALILNNRAFLDDAIKSILNILS